MTMVIADTSPINYLLLIGEIKSCPSCTVECLFRQRSWLSDPIPMRRRRFCSG